MWTLKHFFKLVFFLFFLSFFFFTETSLPQIVIEYHAVATATPRTLEISASHLFPLNVYLAKRHALSVSDWPNVGRLAAPILRPLPVEWLGFTSFKSDQSRPVAQSAFPRCDSDVCVFLIMAREAVGVWTWHLQDTSSLQSSK